MDHWINRVYNPTCYIIIRVHVIIIGFLFDKVVVVRCLKFRLCRFWVWQLNDFCLVQLLFLYSTIFQLCFVKHWFFESWLKALVKIAMLQFCLHEEFACMLQFCLQFCTWGYFLRDFYYWPSNDRRDRVKVDYLIQITTFLKTTNV